MTGSRIRDKGNLLKVYIIFLLALVLFTAIPVLAEEPVFRLDIDNTTLEKGTSANLLLIIENARGAEVLEIEGLENFDILNQGHSTSTSIINGDMTRSEKYNYVIMPLEEGEFSLKGIVRYRGKNYETNQLEVSVKEGTTLAGNEVGDLFIKSVIGRNEVYFGEKIPLGFELYSRYNIENFGFLEELDLTGFITQEISESNLRGNYLEMAGKRYVRYDVKKLLLTPIAAGTYKIPAANFQVNVSTGGFFTSSRSVYLQTEPVEIIVKPLPLAGQPENFTGLVGKLEIESSYSKDELEYGDSLTLKVRLTGSCNLANLDKIISTEIPGLSIYETEIDRVERIESGRYQASKEFEIIMIPDRTGEIEIPTLEIPYFNPLTEKYETAKIQGANIQVKGEVPLKLPVFNQDNETIKTLEPEEIIQETIRIEQINYALGDNNYLLLRIRKDYLKRTLYIILAFLILAIIILFFSKYWRERDNRLRELYREARKEKDELKLFDILNEMLKYRYNLSLKASSRERLKGKMDDQELLQEILEILDYFEQKGLNKSKLKDINLREKIKSIYKKL